MLLRTELKIPKSEHLFDYGSNLLFLGSCFSDNIGKKLLDLKFNCTVNPFGTLFNPISIFKAAVSPPDTNESFIHEISPEIFVHHDYHSDLFASSKEDLISNLETLFHSEFHPSLVKQDLIVLTFGTAIVHELKSEQSIVANCHKKPQNLFNKRFLDVDEIINGYKGFNQYLSKNTKVLLNVSPVRHTKQGLENNQLSKSILRIACAKIAKQYPNVSYFPSYELMIDDLRDYRFYKSDLIHPNEQAIDYIFNQFISSYFSDQSIKDLNEVKKLILELNHKPLFPHSSENLAFLEKLKSKLNLVTNVNFSEELELLSTKIKELTY